MARTFTCNSSKSSASECYTPTQDQQHKVTVLKWVCVELLYMDNRRGNPDNLTL